MESQTRFFKVILQDTLQSKKLVIPKGFVQKYGRDLCSNKVYLKVSSGDTWKVGLHREEDGDMCFLHGWQDFLEFYNIKCGYFFVFDYQGNSEFEVLIFDSTTSEIKYPCKSKSNKNHNADVDPCLLSVKPEMDESDVEMLVDDHNASKLNSHDKNTACKGKGSSDCDYVNEELGTSKTFSPKESTEKAEAIIRSTAFDSSNPYFRIIMRASYVNKNCFLWLPGRFIMDHIGQKGCYLTLSVPCGCGRLWTVKCNFKMRGNQPEAKIQLGWKAFARDNNLVVGDVCIFELIDSVKVHFQVTIFRASEDPRFSHCLVKSEPGECSGRQVSLKPLYHEESSSGFQYAATSNHINGNPSFKLVMTESRMRHMSVPIPRGFLKHLKPSAQIVVLEVSGRMWHVKVCFYRRKPGSEAFFSSGWSKFAKENSLRVGDMCTFELIEREEVVLKASIHKGST